MHSSTETLKEQRDVVERGGFLLTLSEYISRKCRQEITLSTLQSVEKEIQEDRRVNKKTLRRPEGAQTVLARLIGVSSQCVNQWVNGGWQASNANTQTLLELAFHYCPDEAIKHLNHDLRVHRLTFEKIRAGSIVERGGL